MMAARPVALALLIAACSPPGARDTPEAHEPRADTTRLAGHAQTGPSVAAQPGATSPAPTAVSAITSERSDDRSEDGARLIAELGCTACHEIIDRRGQALGAPASGRDCYRCHRRVIAGEFEAEPAKLAEWQQTLPRQFDAPSLRGASRFSRTWLVSYLLQPHDIRPSLDSQMPRIPMTREQAGAIADFLGARPVDAASVRQSGNDIVGDPDRGAEIVARSACATCHAIGANATRAAILAPDLAYAARRYSRANLLAWLQDPLAVKSDTLMPNYQFSRRDAADVAAHLAALVPPAKPVFEPPASLLLERKVRFSEVHKILRARCLHCHNRPSRDGPGGTGYTGGWGYEGKRVGLLTYADVMRGGETRTGRRRSLFDRMPDGYSRLVSHLVARHQEYAGNHSDTVGMPLGQPPLTWAEIRVIHTWIKGGRHR